ncbi:MAG TPA: hypothetical protein VE782_01435 [Myxococcaceae bacterium]|jgi:hypothetical protein|nr:hypothetical protein [Myxococcaceae bacterium]
MTVTPIFLGLLAQAAGAGGVGRGQIQGGWEYVWAAYVVFWLALALYALSLWSRSGRSRERSDL